MKKIYLLFIGANLLGCLLSASSTVNIQSKQDYVDLFRREIEQGIPKFPYDENLYDNSQRFRALAASTYDLVVLISRLQFPECGSSFLSRRVTMFFSEKEQKAVRENYHNILQRLPYVRSDEELSEYLEKYAEQYCKNKKIIDNARVDHKDDISRLGVFGYS